MNNGSSDWRWAPERVLLPGQGSECNRQDHLKSRSSAFNFGTASSLKFNPSRSPLQVNQLFSSLFHSTKVQLNLHLTTSGLLSNPSVTFPAAPVESGIVPVIQHGRKSLLSSASTSSTITSAPITPGTSFNTASNPTRSSALSTLNDLHQKNKSWSRLEPRRVESEGVSVVGRSQIYELQVSLLVRLLFSPVRLEPRVSLEVDNSLLNFPSLSIPYPFPSPLRYRPCACVSIVWSLCLG